MRPRSEALTRRAGFEGRDFLRDLILDKPIIVHNRESTEDMVEVLARSEELIAPNRAVLDCADKVVLLRRRNAFERTLSDLWGQQTHLWGHDPHKPHDPSEAEAYKAEKVALATGEAARVPDLVRINAGVSTQAPTASAAIRENAARMESVRAALRRAGVAERDIQTSSINLHPDWRHMENRTPELVGYRANNQVSVRFRDIANAGRILDALVAAGANEIHGPSFEIERPEAALDEARTQALANARARAELYARALGMRVVRVLSVSEAGMGYMPPPQPAMAEMRAQAGDAATRIDPGEQTITASLTVSFELE